jgi:hypothetical protein
LVHAKVVLFPNFQSTVQKTIEPIETQLLPLPLKSASFQSDITVSISQYPTNELSLGGNVVVIIVLRIISLFPEPVKVSPLLKIAV